MKHKVIISHGELDKSPEKTTLQNSIPLVAKMFNRNLR